jgi:hypothetical protein
MDNAEYYKNVRALIDILLENAAKSAGLDFLVINETAIETSRRIKTLDRSHNNEEYHINVGKIIDMLTKNVSKRFGLDIAMMMGEVAAETTRRINILQKTRS